MKYRIGLDVSGGDYAPHEVFKGVLFAQKEFGKDSEIILIGVEEEIQKEARINKVDIKGKFTIINAAEKIDMGESPAVSVRRKRNSSIVIGNNLLKNKEIDAFVSCGNTGAMVCASTLSLRLIEGIERPGIAVTIPTEKGVTILIDAGANIDCKPLHLLQYGVMSSVYYSLVFDKENPKVGLLNIGEEESKGTDFMKDVHKLFSASPLNFTGNLEAKEIFSGNCDCVVCDGFVGNIALKVSESCAKAIGKFLFEEIKRLPLGILRLLLIKEGLKNLKRKIDPSEYGGAPLLGVDGVVIIAHGRSNAVAVKNAVRAAIQELKRDLIANIRGRVNEVCQDSGVRQILAA